LGIVYGLAMGIAITIAAAVFTDWSSGQVFSKVRPAGFPFESILVIGFGVLPTTAMVGALHFPLDRTARGAAVAGLLSCLPLVLYGRPWLPDPRSILVVWDRVAIALILCGVFVIIAVGLRPQMLGQANQTGSLDRPP
jgi:hypothetical protein